MKKDKRWMLKKKTKRKRRRMLGQRGMNKLRSPQVSPVTRNAYLEKTKDYCTVEGRKINREAILPFLLKIIFFHLPSL